MIITIAIIVYLIINPLPLLLMLKNTYLKHPCRNIIQYYMFELIFDKRNVCIMYTMHNVKAQHVCESVTLYISVLTYNLVLGCSKSRDNSLMTKL